MEGTKIWGSGGHYVINRLSFRVSALISILTKIGGGLGKCCLPPYQLRRPCWRLPEEQIETCHGSLALTQDCLFCLGRSRTSQLSWFCWLRLFMQCYAQDLGSRYTTGWWKCHIKMTLENFTLVIFSIKWRIQYLKCIQSRPKVFNFVHSSNFQLPIVSF